MPAEQHHVEVAHVRDGRTSRGKTVLVDRLWARGQRADEAPWDEPAQGRRAVDRAAHVYGHEADKHAEFVRR